MKYRRYAEYKDSGVEWLGEVPAHWTIKRLRHISPQLSVGVVVNPSNYITDDGVPFLYGSNITEGKISTEACRRIPAQVSCGELAKSLLHANDLVTVRVGYPGVTAVVPPELEGANCASMMIVRKSASFNSHWLCYAMNSHVGRQQVEVVQYGAAQEQFNISHAVDFLFPYPPIEDQDAVAAFLDCETAQIDALIAKQERLIAVLQEKRQALIDNIVAGCNEGTATKLRYCVDLLAGYAFSSEGFSDNSDNIRLLRGINIAPGAIRWDETVYWPDSASPELQPYSLQVGDIVFGMDRPWIGSGLRVADVTRDDVPSLLLQRVARLRALPGLLQSYLRLILESRVFGAYFEPIFTGVSVPHVSAEQILAFPLQLPSADTQESSCRQFQEVDYKLSTLKKTLTISIERLQERRAALISAAVTGKIDVCNHVN